MSKANDSQARLARYAKAGRQFGKPVAVKSTWDTWADHSETERTVMVAEFHCWLLQKRTETERSLMQSKAHQRAIAPFADAGLKQAETPQDVPMCVLEFAHTALEVMDLKRQLALLNVYYDEAAHDVHENRLGLDARNEAAVTALWDWFIGERDEEKAKAA